MLDIIGVGESDIDLYIKVDNTPARGEKSRGVELGKFPGGITGNFCSAVAKHGLNCGIVSALGDDEFGKLALSDYEKRGIDTQYINIKKGGKTFYCIVYLDKKGEKYLTAVVTPLISPEINDIDINYLKMAKIVHLTSMDYALVDYITNALEGFNIKVSLDYEAHADRGGFKNWEDILKRVSILFINEGGMNNLFPNKTPDKAAEILNGLGIDKIVYTCGSSGGHVYTSGNKYSYKAFKVKKIKDTTGAGDCFNAAFLSGLLKNMSIEETMRYAAASSALAIQQIGARSGLPTSKEIETFLNSNPDVLP